MEINLNEVSSEEGVSPTTSVPQRRGKVYVKRAKLKLLFKHLFNTLNRRGRPKLQMRGRL